MSLDPHALIALEIPDSRQDYTATDVMLYALATGYGYNPLNEKALEYCYEERLRVAPTFPLVLAHPGFWMRDLDTKIDWRKIVHAEQHLELYEPLPIQGLVRGLTRTVAVVDKGVGRGALVSFDRDLVDDASGRLLARMRQINFCRGDGGCGSAGLPNDPLPAVPDRRPDLIIELPTRPETALLYRLTADLNPLHASPAAARLSGYSQPILHGLVTFAVVGHAIVRGVCGYDARLLKSLSGRFTGVVYPGESISTEIWKEGGHLHFRGLVTKRQSVVMNHGFALLDCS
jgi:acyl dehydratase